MSARELLNEAMDELAEGLCEACTANGYPRKYGILHAAAGVALSRIGNALRELEQEEQIANDPLPNL